MVSRESTRQSFVTSAPAEYVETAMLNQENPSRSAFAGWWNAAKNDVTQAGLCPPISDAPTSESRIFLVVSSRSCASDRPNV